MDVEQYRQPAYATALAILGDHHLAEDAVQDAFVEALRSWDRIREPEARPAWVRAIVRHRCHRLLRRRDMGGAPLPELRDAAEPWEHVARTETASRLLARLRSLPQASDNP